MRRVLFLAMVVWVCFGFAGVVRGAEEGVSLTIYTDNFGVVRESRNMTFQEGVNTIKFTDVASAIDATSVNFKCLSSPGAISILEQNYEYDLVDTESLLKRYIDKEIMVQGRGSGADVGRTVNGILMGARGNSLILNRTPGIEIISRDSVEAIMLKEGPADLVTKPTLVWLAQADKGGAELCQVTYTTGQIGWKADYSAVLSDDERSLDFSGWVTIDNQSGATIRNAGLKLIAGDVRRVQPVRPMMKGREMMMMDMAAAAPAFEEKAFMEYHLYTLGRKSTINNNQVKQIEFIEPATGVAVQKLYIYERTQQPDKVQIKLEFENKEENKLGIALPKGKVRVFKRDPADETLEFVGEDEIDHTPRKEKLLLYIGNAFDIVPEYTMVDSRRERRRTTEKHKIEFRNRKDSAVEVFADEKFSPWVNWTIDEKTHEYEKRDAQTARFKVKIEADSTATLEYTATQTW
jgi:hypothetical protein